LPILADQFGAVRERTTGQLLLPLAGKLAGFAQTQARRLRENELGFALQTATVPPGAFSQSPNGLVGQTPYQYLSHTTLSMSMLSE
jgi:hypothetical protein